MRKLLLAFCAFATICSAGAQWKPAGDKIKTDWAEKVDPRNVLPEYPRPGMERADWQNLNGEWEYANNLSTYVIVTGRVEMDLVNDDAGQTLGGEVQYIIHLGDFGTGGNISDFSTLRNTSYTYTVTVNSVNNIRVEVDTETTENQPGATGSVTIAKEEIALCDAHYVSKTLTFHAKYITDDLTWYVKTPFCDGKPQIIEGEDVPTGLDYKWCHFRLNQKDGEGNYYVKKRRKYTPEAYNAITCPDGEMDIITLVKYIKAQKKLYDDPQLSSTSDFDNTSEALRSTWMSITTMPIPSRENSVPRYGKNLSITPIA